MMKKLTRLMPILILALLFVYLLLPTQTDDGSQVPSLSSDAAVSDSIVTDPLSLSSTKSGKASSSGGKTAAGTPQNSAAPAWGAADHNDITADEEGVGEEDLLPEDGSYTSKEDVSLYLVQYGHLPSNFITKKEAQKAGWTGGSLEKILPGMCIGGDYFGNYEGLLPKAKGRTWTECDIDTLGARSRGAKRLIFSNDGLIYYTEDHYESFTQLY